MKLLIVDDDSAQLDIRKLIFEQHGFEVETAANPFTARMLMDDFAPDTVLMDLRLPDPGDGLDLISALRGRARIVVLSGFPGDLDGHPHREWVHGIAAKPARTEQILKLLLA
ncbi:MAG: response regulator [Bryobacteraceae bacterium]|nr:response regulator [Bryobacteraceae bacterium]